MYDNMLRMDDRIREFFFFLHKTRFRMVTGGADAVEIEFFRLITNVDPWQYLYPILYMSPAYILLLIDILNNVCFQ